MGKTSFSRLISRLNPLCTRYRAVLGSLLVFCSAFFLPAVQADTWRVGDRDQSWQLFPVSFLMNAGETYSPNYVWGGSWAIEIVVDDDGDGLVDEDPVDLIDQDSDGLFNEDPEDGRDNDRDGLVDEDDAAPSSPLPVSWLRPVFAYEADLFEDVETRQGLRFVLDADEGVYRAEGNDGTTVEARSAPQRFTPSDWICPIRVGFQPGRSRIQSAGRCRAVSEGASG